MHTWLVAVLVHAYLVVAVLVHAYLVVAVLVHAYLVVAVLVHAYLVVAVLVECPRTAPCDNDRLGLVVVVQLSCVVVQKLFATDEEIPGIRLLF
jgi:hypothetical protein